MITKEDLKIFKEIKTNRGYCCTDLYSDIAYKNALNSVTLEYLVLKLNGEAGEIAEHLGKAIRDENFKNLEDLSEIKKELIIKELGDVIWYINAIARLLNVRLSDVLESNLVKLQKRVENGTLQGSGDNR